MTVMLIAMLSLGALAIGISQIQLARGEAQIVADCSSISGATIFGETLLGAYSTPASKAQQTSKINRVMGVSASINSSDVVLGRVTTNTAGKSVFAPHGSPENALRVTVRLADGAATAKQPLLFPFMFSTKTFGLHQTSVSAKLAHDVALVIDRSQSMNQNLKGGFPPFDTSNPSAKFFPHPTQSRWAKMLQAMEPMFEGFASSKIEEQFTLVTFGSYREYVYNGKKEIYQGATTDISLTKDTLKIKRSLNHMWDTRPMISGQTWIDAGLSDALVELTRDTARNFSFKTIILLTDGQQFPVNNKHYVVAQEIAAKGITIHTIAFAEGNGFKEMQDIANIGGGKAFYATDTEELKSAFKELASMAPVAMIE